MSRITSKLQVTIPKHLAGLLADGAIQGLLEEAMRRQAGRRLLEIAEGVHATGIPPMSDEEIVAEVKSVRAERHSREANRPDSWTTSWAST